MTLYATFSHFFPHNQLKINTKKVDNHVGKTISLVDKSSKLLIIKSF
jgi:hypothetical protein